MTSQPPTLAGIPIADVREKLAIAMVRLAAQGSVPAARTVLDLLDQAIASAPTDEDHAAAVEMPREEYLASALTDAHADIHAARRSAQWQAVVALRRQAMEIRDRIDDDPAEVDELSLILADAV